MQIYLQFSETSLIENSFDSVFMSLPSSDSSIKGFFIIYFHKLLEVTKIVCIFATDS